MNIDKTQNIDAVTNETTDNQAKKDSISDKAFKDLLRNYIDKTNSLTTEVKQSKNSKTAAIENKLQSNNEVYNSFNDLKINYINDKELNSSLITEILNKENSIPEIENSRKLKLEEIKNRVNSGFYQTDNIIEQTAGKIIDSTII